MIEADASEPTPNPAAPGPQPSVGGFTEEQLKHAFHALKKRIRLTKLDQESKLGVSRPMTSGKNVGDISMQPPREFPREIWGELVKQGKIKDRGGGFYSLT